MHTALPEPNHSLNPTAPLPKGHRLPLHVKGQAYLFTYTTAPTSNSLSGITHHTDIIGGLSRLDADCVLAKRVRKKGRFLHTIIDVERLR